ncbi:hypothetical protein O3P69_000100 [Scylla paramamosain]|uniref:Gustatory receptor n=1 Tax=Scylla paramamosain TaxID=85552 RepID=A0AAW0UWZ4_SCYPA
MKSSKVTINPGTEPLHPERLFNWLPRAMVVFSIFIFFTVSSTEYLMGVDFERMDKEVPTLVVLLVCLTFPFVSTLFVVVLTRWLEIVYKALNRYCKEVMPVSDVDKVLAVCSYVDRLQKIFGLLDVGFFRYILSINAASITVGASLCMARLMQDYTQIVYLGPLVFHGFILALTCEGGERLAAQHAGLVAWLKKEIRRHKLPAVPSSPPPSLSFVIVLLHLKPPPPPGWSAGVPASDHDPGELQASSTKRLMAGNVERNCAEVTRADKE